MLKNILGITILSFILIGCGSSINLKEFKKQDLANKSSKKMTSKKQNIVIMKFNENSTLAKDAQLGNSMSSYINLELSELSSVDILRYSSDKSFGGQSSTKLAKELGVNRHNTDYIVSANINKTTYDYEYVPEGTALLLTGKLVKTPAKYKYKACVSGDIKVYNFSSVRLAKSFEFDKCETMFLPNLEESIKYKNDRLVRKTANKALEDSVYKLKNFFSVKGYIVEKRAKEDEVIVKTTLTKSLGAKKGEAVEIYRNNTIIGKGTISNNLSNSGSWVIVDSLDDGINLSSKDFVKIKYSKGLFDF